MLVFSSKTEIKTQKIRSVSLIFNPITGDQDKFCDKRLRKIFVDIQKEDKSRTNNPQVESKPSFGSFVVTQ